MSKEHIEREPLISDLELLAKYENGERQQGILGVCETIRNRKAADVVEVRHGEWEVHLNSDGALNHYECSVCHKAQGHISNYCEDCGTKMDGKGNDNV